MQVSKGAKEGTRVQVCTRAQQINTRMQADKRCEWYAYSSPCTLGWMVGRIEGGWCATIAKRGHSCTCAYFHQLLPLYPLMLLYVPKLLCLLMPTCNLQCPLAILHPLAPLHLLIPLCLLAPLHPLVPACAYLCLLVPTCACLQPCAFWCPCIHSCPCTHSYSLLATGETFTT